MDSMKTSGEVYEEVNRLRASYYTTKLGSETQPRCAEQEKRTKQLNWNVEKTHTEERTEIKSVYHTRKEPRDVKGGESRSEPQGKDNR